jgi:hypothetical protein
MRLNGRHGTSGATGTTPGSATSGRQDDLASSSGMGECLFGSVYDRSINSCVIISDRFYVHYYGLISVELVLLSTHGFSCTAKAVVVTRETDEYKECPF